jgi:cytochrome c biogenesis protein CcmG/thiol:disulfide interchange protein DsbE
MTDNPPVADDALTERDPAAVDAPASDDGNGSTTDGAKTGERNLQTTFWRLAIVAGLLAFIWFLTIGLHRQNESQQRASGMAPDFEFTTFEGETIRLSDLQGQGVVVNFWASWCEPCRSEAVIFEQTWREEKDNGIVFIGLDYLDQEYAAKEYLAEFDITYPNGPDLQSEAARSYGIKGVPETFFIDPEGRIESRSIGPVISQAELNNKLEGIRP